MLVGGDSADISRDMTTTAAHDPRTLKRGIETAVALVVALVLSIAVLVGLTGTARAQLTCAARSIAAATDGCDEEDRDGARSVHITFEKSVSSAAATGR